MKIQYGSLYREELAEGCLLSLGWGGGEDFCTDRQIHQYAFTVVANGQDLTGSLEQAGELTRFTEPNGDEHTVLPLRSTRQPLTLAVHTLLDPPEHPGGASRSLQRYLTITNTSNDPLPLTSLQVLSGGLFAGERGEYGVPAYRVGVMCNGTPGQEGDFRWQPMVGGTYSYALRRYAERYLTPFAIAEDVRAGRYAVMHLGFTGGFEMNFDNLVVDVPAYNNLSFSLAVGVGQPLYVLAPGESITTPAAHVTLVEGSLDEAIQASHTHVRRYGKCTMVECSTMTKTEADVWHTLDIAERFGAEIFYIDAGWYIPKTGELDRWPAYTGDWRREVDTYGDSTLDDFREAAHKKGILFGLWMDPEKLGFDTEVLASGQLKVLTAQNGQPIPDGPCSYMTDLTDPATARWLYESICYVIERYQLDFFRLDSGAFPVEAYAERFGMSECCDFRYHKVLYDILNRLRERYPNVIFQNCSGGGCRVDLGLMPMLSNTWISDQNRAPHSMRIINGTSMMLPVEYCVKLINGMGAQVYGCDYFKLNAARFGIPLIPILMDDPEFCRRADAMIQHYKQYIRPMLPTCKVWHHTPLVRLEEPGARGVLEISSPDGSTAMVAGFTLGAVTDPDFPLRFCGVSPDKTYTVWCNDRPYGRYTGKALLDGVTVQIPQMWDSVCLLAVAEPTEA